MTLAANFQARYSNEYVVLLTNPDQPRNTATVNTARLDAAAQDATVEFEQIAGTEYDDDNPNHVAAAVLGVKWKLLQFNGKNTDDVNRSFNEFKASADRVGTASIGGGRDRVLPQTTSNLEPSTQPDNTLPDQDRQRWDGNVVPRTRPGDDTDSVRGQPGSRA